jgi:hypothetical protein
MQAFHQLQGLRPKTYNIHTFNIAAENFDRTFLTGLEKSVWEREINAFLQSMTDNVIDEALRKQPKEVQPFHSQQIAQVLKERRKNLKKDMLEYYEALAKTVAITGSNEREQFRITKNADETLLVEVNRLEENDAVGPLLYRRLFQDKETREIQVYGLEGNDKFLVSGGHSDIDVRLIGGPGNDSFINEGGSSDVKAYDVTFENNTISGAPGIRNKFSDDPMNNEYRRLGFNYNSSSPGIALEYSSDGGLFLGLSYKKVTHEFRKDPFESKHLISFARALNSKSYHFKYNADFIKVIGKEDMFIRTDVKMPTSRTRFFGYGNNTVIGNTASPQRAYYLAHYLLGDLAIMGKHSFSSWFNISYGPIAQFLRLSRNMNDNTYIKTIFPTGANEDQIYKGHWYAGGAIRAEVNTRNNEVLPTRGINVNGYAKRLEGLTENSNSFSEVGGNLAFYTDFLLKNHIVIANNFGGGHIIGDFEFPQAQYLGFRQNLRGYRIQRFAGRSRVYNNSEIRLLLGQGNFYLFKAPFGIFGFNDMGRVWMDGEKSDTWHHGYGGGIWLAPLKQFVVTAAVTYSNEEKNLSLITFGFQF